MSANEYVCARKIASGGMGELMLAAQRGMGGFDRLVVVKQIHSRLQGDDRFVKMFLAEAQLAASLEHPHVVDIIDVCRMSDDYAVVMEYLSGETLGYVLRATAAAETRIPLPMACRMAADVADALAFAHGATDVDGRSRGIVHHDVCPANIMLTYDGVVKLIDFGVARANEHHLYSPPGALKGKLPYASPEHVLGTEVDERSDLFSVGAVLHEMLTSRRLFTGPSEAAIARNVMERRVPPPSIYNPQVPDELDRITLQLLQRDPAHRTASAAVLRDELESLLETGGQVTQRALGRYLRDALPGRHRERKHIERQVIAESRAPGAASPTLAQLAPMMSDELTEVASAAASAPSHSTDMSSPARLGTVTGTAIQAAPAPRAPTGRWVLVAALLMIAAGGISLAAFSLGQRDSAVQAPPPPAAPAESDTSAAAADSDPTTGPAAVDAAFLIHVEPGDATIAIDGDEITTTAGPDGVLVSTKPGQRRTLRVSKSGHEPHEVDLNAPGSGTMAVYIKLSPAATNGELRVVSARTGPSNESRRNSRHRNRGRDRDRNSERDDKRNAAAPAVAATSTLIVDYAPAAAELTVDGARSAGPSPHTLTLLPGSHTVRVAASDHETVSRRVSLEPGATYEIAVNLSRTETRYARVDVRSEPAGAEVHIDGRRKGTTPVEGLLTEVGTEVDIRLTRSGYKPWQQRLTPPDDTKRTVAAQLEAVPAPEPIETPATPPPAAKPRVVPPTAVTRVSGNAPALRARRSDLPERDRVTARLCIDRRGAVTSAAVLTKVSRDVRRQFQSALRRWRYKPFRAGGKPEPVCFAIAIAWK